MNLPSMRINRPIFVVGSPRSGTSILTWCLGQHSNIFVQEESNWIGRFTLQMEIAYRIGTARGERSQLSALDVRREDFFACFGRSINELILDHRQKLEAKIAAKRESRRVSSAPPSIGHSSISPFQITRSKSDPKARWVDGTPEYSFYINPLRKLFPEARFIHIVRDVSSVVRSMMHFQNTGGPALVAEERQAYQEWLKTVRACHEAECAYGSDIVRRIRYSDLIDDPNKVIEVLLAFLDEKFEPACLEPLQKRINSSNVPADIEVSDPGTDQALINEATKLSSELTKDTPQLAPDPDAVARMEQAFNDRVDYLAKRESYCP